MVLYWMSGLHYMSSLHSAEEMAGRQVLQCPTHDQIQQGMCPDLQILSDPRRLWSYRVVPSAGLVTQKK